VVNLGYKLDRSTTWSIFLQTN